MQSHVHLVHDDDEATPTADKVSKSAVVDAVEAIGCEIDLVRRPILHLRSGHSSGGGHDDAGLLP